jgi:hypothetical protein
MILHLPFRTASSVTGAVLFALCPLASPAQTPSAAPAPFERWSLDKLDGQIYRGTATKPANPATTLGNVEPVPGRVGGAVGFREEAPGIVTMALAPGALPATEFTIAFWLRPSVPPQSYGTCLDMGGKRGLALSLNNQGRLSLSANDKWHTLITPAPLPLNEWLRVAVVFQDNRLRLFLGGKASGEVLLTTTPEFSSILQFGAHTRIIRLPDGTQDEMIASPLTGEIDEITLFQRALTETELVHDAR